MIVPHAVPCVALEAPSLCGPTFIGIDATACDNGRRLPRLFEVAVAIHLADYS